MFLCETEHENLKYKKKLWNLVKKFRWNQIFKSDRKIILTKTRIS